MEMIMRKREVDDEEGKLDGLNTNEREGHLLNLPGSGGSSLGTASVEPETHSTDTTYSHPSTILTLTQNTNNEPQRTRNRERKRKRRLCVCLCNEHRCGDSKKKRGSTIASREREARVRRDVSEKWRRVRLNWHGNSSRDFADTTLLPPKD